MEGDEWAGEHEEVRPKRGKSIRLPEDTDLEAQRYLLPPVSLSTTLIYVLLTPGQISIILPHRNTQNSPFLRIKYLPTASLTALRRLPSLGHPLATTAADAGPGRLPRPAIRIHWPTARIEYPDWR